MTFSIKLYPYHFPPQNKLGLLCQRYRIRHKKYTRQKPENNKRPTNNDNKRKTQQNHTPWNGQSEMLGLKEKAFTSVSSLNPRPDPPACKLPTVTGLTTNPAMQYKMLHN